MIDKYNISEFIMEKNEALRICIRNGVLTKNINGKLQIGNNYALKGKVIEHKRGCTFASKNSNTAANCYWASPSPSELKKDWVLILNDTDLNMLYFFFIPANTFTQTQFDTRQIGKKNKIMLDISIPCGKPTFTDSGKGKVCFDAYKFEEIQYTL
ncbi:MAG: hypothetical protein K6G80_11235 [Treponema sp.]|nr:hypothetical protein [Treponema sp.]